MIRKLTFFLPGIVAVLSMVCSLERNLFHQENVPVVSAGNDTVVSIKDTVLLHAVATDNNGYIDKWEWRTNMGGWFVRTGGDTTLYMPDVPFVYRCSVRVTDDEGFIAVDEVKITVIQDVPVVNAGKDTTVSINDLIRLHGSAKDSFGVIVKWEWDFGNTGTFKQTSKSDTNIIAPASQNFDYKCVLRVTDDDGNAAKDTVKIIVYDGFVADIDGNVYHTVKIGTQTWMVENLKTTRYNDGTAIPLVTDNATWLFNPTPGYCWYNNDSAAYKNIYGALYKWHTVFTGKLAPAGWHVPTDAEWSTLTTYLGGEGVAGGKLKEAGLAHWNSPNTGATNETGFSALPVGRRDYDGSFLFFGKNGFWWSSTPSAGTGVWYRYMFYDIANIGRSSEVDITYGLSVRCVRD